MKRSTFEITASIGSVIIFILLCIALKSGIGFVISLLVFVIIISAAGLKLADFGGQ